MYITAQLHQTRRYLSVIILSAIKFLSNDKLTFVKLTYIKFKSVAL
jgi:hypothetical protein